MKDNYYPIQSNLEEKEGKCQSKNPKLKDLIHEMDVLMVEMQERMVQVMQRQKDTFALAFRSVLVRIIDEFKLLKEVLVEQAEKMKESNLVDKKLEFFRSECSILNDIINEYQKENKELKEKLMTTQQVLFCNEKALINQGNKFMDFKKRSQSTQEEIHCSIIQVKKKFQRIKLNKDKFSEKEKKNQPFQIDDEQKTQINVYLLDKVANEATENILSRIDEPRQIRQIIKKLLIENISAIKHQTSNTYVQHITHEIEELALVVLSQEEHILRNKDSELKEIFQDAIRAINGSQKTSKLSPKSINRNKYKQVQTDIVTCFLSDTRFLKMIENKMFGQQCCKNKNCVSNLHNYQFLKEQSTLGIMNSKVSTNLSPRSVDELLPQIQNLDTLAVKLPVGRSEVWKQYGRHNFDFSPQTTPKESNQEELQKLKQQYKFSYHQLKSYGNPKLITGSSREEQLKNQCALQETEINIKNLVNQIKSHEHNTLRLL